MEKLAFQGRYSWVLDEVRKRKDVSDRHLLSNILEEVANMLRSQENLVRAGKIAARKIHHNQVGTLVYPSTVIGKNKLPEESSSLIYRLVYIFRRWSIDGLVPEIARPVDLPKEGKSYYSLIAGIIKELYREDLTEENIRNRVYKLKKMGVKIGQWPEQSFIRGLFGDDQIEIID